MNIKLHRALTRSCKLPQKIIWNISVSVLYVTKRNQDRISFYYSAVINLNATPFYHYVMSSEEPKNTSLTIHDFNTP